MSLATVAAQARRGQKLTGKGEKARRTHPAYKVRLGAGSMPTTPPPTSRGRSQVRAAEPGAGPPRLRRVRPAPPRQVRPTPRLGATFSCVPASAIRRSAPRPGGGLPGLGRVAECCWASRDRVGRQLRRRTRQKPAKGASGDPGASKSYSGAQPHLTARACSARARPFPHLLARPSPTASGSRPGAARAAGHGAAE